MIKVIIQEQPYSIPKSIADISIGRFIDFRNLDPNNHLDMIHWILNSKPIFKQDKSIEIVLANVLSMAKPCIDEIYEFMNNKAKNQTPTHIEVLGETFELKKGLLNDLPYWPYVVTKSIIIKNLENHNFDPTDDIPKVLAHYLYNYVTKNEYTERKAEEFIDVINDINMIPAIQLGNFFLKKQQSLWQSSRSNLKTKLKLHTSKPV